MRSTSSQDGGRQRFLLHEFQHRLQKLLLTKSPVILLVTLALQFLNVLFELQLFFIIPLGHLHKPLIRQLARYIILGKHLSGVKFKEPRRPVMMQTNRLGFKFIMSGCPLRRQTGIWMPL